VNALVTIVRLPLALVPIVISILCLPLLLIGEIFYVVTLAVFAPRGRIATNYQYLGQTGRVPGSLWFLIEFSYFFLTWATAR
jgi:hypothetical protein